MAQVSVPWRMMAQNQPPIDPMEQILKMQGLGLEAGPNEAAIEQMAAQGSPAVPTPPVPTAPRALAPKSPAPRESVSEKISMSYISPEDEIARQDLLQKMNALQEARQTEEQAGIQDYQKDVDKYSGQELGYNFAPLSSLLSKYTGVDTTQAMQAIAPETPEQKREKLMGMKKTLQGMKGDLSKSQYGMLKDQLDVYNNALKLEFAQKRADQSLAARSESQERLRERDTDKDLMEFQKRVQPFQKVDNTLGDVEKNLGFDLGEFDEITNTVRGEKADAPGVTVPILGRLNQATPESRRFKASLQRLLNTVLKERSGAAVTDSEQHRLLTEFSNDRMRFTTESDLLATLKSYKKLLDADKADVMGGFRPAVVDKYFNRQGRAAEATRPGPSATKKPSFEEWKKQKGL